MTDPAFDQKFTNQSKYTNKEKNPRLELKFPLKLDFGEKEVFLCNVVSLKPLKKTERMKQ